MKTILKITGRVFLLEDSAERIKWFKERVPDITVCSTAEEAISKLAISNPFDVVFLDHDLGILDYSGTPIGGVGTGKQVAMHLAATGFLGKNVVIHSWNNNGAAEMAACLKGAVVIPFGRFEIEYA